MQDLAAEFSKELLELEMSSKEYCKEVKLDQAIRTLCRGEGSQGNGYLRSIEIPLLNGKILELREDGDCAYVRYKNTPRQQPHLYTCYEYGEHLYNFQYGDWVDAVLKLAKQEALTEEARRQEICIRQLQQELLKWMPEN